MWGTFELQIGEFVEKNVDNWFFFICDKISLHKQLPKYE